MFIYDVYIVVGRYCSYKRSIIPSFNFMKCHLLLLYFSCSSSSFFLCSSLLISSDVLLFYLGTNFLRGFIYLSFTDFLFSDGRTFDG